MATSRPQPEESGGPGRSSRPGSPGTPQHGSARPASLTGSRRGSLATSSTRRAAVKRGSPAGRRVAGEVRGPACSPMRVISRLVSPDWTGRPAPDWAGVGLGALSQAAAEHPSGGSPELLLGCVVAQCRAADAGIYRACGGKGPPPSPGGAASGLGDQWQGDFLGSETSVRDDAGISAPGPVVRACGGGSLRLSYLPVSPGNAGPVPLCTGQGEV